MAGLWPDNVTALIRFVGSRPALTTETHVCDLVWGLRRSFRAPPVRRYPPCRRSRRDRIPREHIVDRFKAAIRGTKEVMIGYYVTGDADFILVITAKDMEDYEAFTRRFFYENHDIKGFTTMVVMDRVKAGFAFPIEG